MEKSIVIARYNENIDWLENIEEDINIFLYQKGNQEIPNFLKKRNNLHIEKLNKIGNEQHTYFYHIVNNYNLLDDLIFFIQANPFEHCINFSEKLKNNTIGGLSDFNLTTSIFGTYDKSLNVHINHKYDNLSPDQIIGKVFIDPWNNQDANLNIKYILNFLNELNFNNEDWVFNANGLYSIKKEDIHHFDIDFYNKCLEIFDKSKHNINMAEYAFERISKFIFYKRLNIC